MARAWLFSSVLHVALAALLYFGLPSLSRPPPAMEQAITVELVNQTPDLEPEPPAPAPAATAPKPAQRAARPDPTPAPPPEPKVEPKPAPEPPQAEAPPEPKPEPAPPPPPAVQPPPEPEPPAKSAVAEAPPPPEPEPAPRPDATPVEPAPEPPPKPDVAKAEPEPPPKPAVQPKPEPAPEPKVAALQPEPKPEPKPEAKPVAKSEPPPTPEPPAPKPLLKPPAPELAERTPPPKAEPAAPKEDAFAALLKSVEKLDRQVESDTTRAGTGHGAATDGRARTAIGEAQLSFSEIDALRRQIGGCWTLPVGVEGIDDMVVQLRIQVRPDRTVQNVEIDDQARLGRDAIFRAVAESARRAVDKCSPLILPPGKYALWRDIHLNFRPADAING